MQRAPADLESIQAVKEVGLPHYLGRVQETYDGGNTAPAGELVEIRILPDDRVVGIDVYKSCGSKSELRMPLELVDAYAQKIGPPEVVASRPHVERRVGRL